ncbi:MAG: hypothetical protein MUP85_07265 [Candidatus Lokiarchaeota archaeon]|nr:hypothetical protein [Candidatus Lokiarchaeota archaeon]
MLRITILLNRVWFSPDQSNKVAKAYVDWLKDNPPDKTIQKTICVAVGTSENGNILTYGVSQVKKGKEQEALQSTTQADLFMASKLEGLKYKVDILLDFTEAYKILGMAPPEEV